MPIPGSRANSLIDPACRAGISDFGFPATCTFYSRTMSSETTGQKKPVFTQMGSSRTNMECRFTPLIEIRTQKQVREGSVITKDAEYQLSIFEYVNDVPVDHHVLVQSRMYRVLGVDWDGNNKQTRFLLSSEVPFNG